MSELKTIDNHHNCKKEEKKRELKWMDDEHTNTPSFNSHFYQNKAPQLLLYSEKIIVQANVFYCLRYEICTERIVRTRQLRRE